MERDIQKIKHHQRIRVSFYLFTCPTNILANAFNCLYSPNLNIVKRTCFSNFVLKVTGKYLLNKSRADIESMTLKNASCLGLNSAGMTNSLTPSNNQFYKIMQQGDH